MLVIQDMNDEDQRNLENFLHNYDFEKTHVDFDKIISFGIYNDGKMVAGIKGKLEAYKIMYVETLFVSESYRKLGLGSSLLKMIEERAVFEGIKTIRLDTFSWQAKDFYINLGYEVVGSYEIDKDMFEYFLIKRL